MKHLNDYDIFSCMVKSLPLEAPRCPSCNAPSSKYRHNGSYLRHFVCYTDTSVCSHTITVPSLLCSSCKKTHALLPSIVIPYSPYSLGFIISLFYARLTRHFPTVLSLCEHFDISESTYYRMRKRFTLDSRALADALDAFMEASCLPQALSAADPIILHSVLSIFFQSTGYSFMQPCIRLRPKIHIHDIPPGFFQIT